MWRAHQNVTSALWDSSSAHPPSSIATLRAQSHPSPQAADPTTLVIGDLIMRLVRRRSVVTYFFPGAKENDILVKTSVS